MKRDELVERIVHDIEMYHRWASQGTIHHNTSQRIARGIITLILSAFRDGELDEELGVVQRYKDDIYLPGKAEDGRVIGIRTRCLLLALSGTEEE